jgi:hypothetical protein
LRIANGQNYKQKGSFLSELTSFCGLLFCVAFSMTAITMNLLQRGKFKLAIELIGKFDAKVEEFGFEVDNERQRRRAVVISSSVVLGYVCLGYIPWSLHAFTVDAGTEEIVAATIFHIMFIGALLFSGTCIVIVDLLKHRFEILNKILAKTSDEETFRSVASLHIVLCNLVVIFNQLGCFLMAMLFGCGLMCGTFVIYEFFDIIVYRGVEGNGGLLLLMAIVLIVNQFYDVLNCVFVWECSALMSEGRRGGRMVFGGKRVQLFDLQVEHTEVEVSCGLFAFDWRSIQRVSVNDDCSLAH